MPILLDCNFIVDSANGNGLGLRSLKGPYVSAAYMHTSATPAAGSPNPASGTIVVQLSDAYTRIYSGGHSIVSPVGSSQIVSSGLTIGVAYVITILGDALPADWIALGIPAGVTPAVGLAFIAKATGAGAATVSRVAPTAAAGSGVATIETLGDTNQAIAPKAPAAPALGAQIILQCRDYAGALVAPVDGSVISLSFYLSNSSVTVNGE